jgi:transcriptional antiterminator NusG
MDDNQVQDQNTEEVTTPEPVADVQAAEVVEAAPIEEAPVAETVAPAEDTTSSDTAEPVSDTPSNARWYVVHTYSGHENRVAQTLKQRVEAEHLENKIFDVLVPTQDKIEIKGGKKATIKEKIFPGYILVKMILDDESWLAVRTTQGVTSFIGMGSKPTPISETEVKSIIKFMDQGGAPTYKTVYNEGDTVKITEGPFTEFIGKVDNVDKDRGKVRVLVSIFGRETPVELDFLQVQKL